MNFPTSISSSKHMNIKSGNYIPSLDGLRAISILLVLASHLLVASNLTTTSPIPGGLGVTIFFFISGYLITGLLLSELKNSHRIDAKAFYIRRFLRLYPPMLIMILCIMSFLWINHKPVSFQESLAAIFYYENYYLAQNPASDGRYSILWSLAVEEHFYLIYPLIVIVCGRRLKLLLGITLLLTVIPLCLRLFIAYEHNADSTSLSYTYSLTHCRFDSILYGCLTSILINSDYSNKFFKIISSRPVYISSLILFCILFVIRDEFFKQTIRFSLQGICFIILIPGIIYSKSSLNRFFSLKALLFIGKLSYSIYLFHYAVIEMMRDYSFQSPFIYIIVNLTLSTALSLGSYYFIEIPMMSFRKRYGSNVKAESPAELSNNTVRVYEDLKM
jgi:peptidoglycan/LPS O-acetylase OafA/YrhL